MIYIADDGSSNETAQLIEEKKSIFKANQLHHIWHEDNGYRKSTILNKTIQSLPAEIDWVIFVDADTFLHPKFIADHLAMKASNRIFKGRRVELNAWISDWMRKHPTLLWNKNSNALSNEFYKKLIASTWKKNPTKNLNRAWRIENSEMRKVFGYDKVPDLLGSNFSICRQLLDRLKGFDESSKRYWGEDGDLYVRALEAGAESVGRKCWAVQFHMWHPRKTYDLDAEKEYQARLAKAQAKLTQAKLT